MCLSQVEEELVSATQRSQVTDTPDRVVVTIPGLRIRNGCNLREHWSVRAKRVKRERFLVGAALWKLGRARPELSNRDPRVAWRYAPALWNLGPTPVIVTLTRCAGRLLDDDNAIAGFKGVRDEVADWLGVDDRDPRVTWRYAQERSKGYAVRIEIDARTM